MADLDDELQWLDIKIKQLKLEYEQYFSGNRPREPHNLRADVQKFVMRQLSTPIKNTAQRFRFNSLNQRFQTFKRQWDGIIRQIENGTYKRHLFKADLHDRERGMETPTGPRPGVAAERSPKELFEAYRDAAEACGQNVKGLTQAKLQAVIAKQEKAVRSKLGCDKVNFRVVVEGGKVKLKASAG